MKTVSSTDPPKAAPRKSGHADGKRTIGAIMTSKEAGLSNRLDREERGDAILEAGLPCQLLGTARR